MNCEGFRISDFLRTKGVYWRWGYLGVRTFMDLVPSLLVLSCMGWFVGMGGEEFADDDVDVIVFFMESLIFICLCKLQWVYELPFLCSQYGLRGGRIKSSLLGMSLEYISEERNWYIVYLFLYKLIFFCRLISGGSEGEYMLLGVVFDYLFQYLLILAWWLLRSVFFKFMGMKNYRRQK